MYIWLWPTLFINQTNLSLTDPFLLLIRLAILIWMIHCTLRKALCSILLALFRNFPLTRMCAMNLHSEHAELQYFCCGCSYSGDNGVNALYASILNGTFPTSSLPANRAHKLQWKNSVCFHRSGRRAAAGNERFQVSQRRWLPSCWSGPLPVLASAHTRVENYTVRELNLNGANSKACLSPLGD